jgi:hypothetical protein
MQLFSVPIDCRGRLRAAIALRLVEIKHSNGMLTESTFERNAAVVRLLGYVMSHTSL